MYVAGIDEAGRGPVIGPIVMASTLFEESNLDELEALKITDSKLISPKRRELLYSKIENIAKEVIVTKVSAKDIDLQRKKYSLNMIETKMGIKLINGHKIAPDRVYVDCPDINPNRYRQMLYSYLDRHTDLVVEHKADLTYIACSAASVIAKVERDRAIRNLEDNTGIKIGSGYPSDPNTKKFLSEHYKNPIFLKDIRTSWKTYENLVNKSRQKTLFNE